MHLIYQARRLFELKETQPLNHNCNHKYQPCDHVSQDRALQIWRSQTCISGWRRSDQWPFVQNSALYNKGNMADGIAFYHSQHAPHSHGPQGHCSGGASLYVADVSAPTHTEIPAHLAYLQCTASLVVREQNETGNRQQGRVLWGGYQSTNQRFWCMLESKIRSLVREKKLEKN